MNRFLSLSLAAGATLLVTAAAQANELSLSNTPFQNLSLASDGPNLGGYVLVHYGDDDDGGEMNYRAVRVEMKGTRGAVSYAVSADLKGTIDNHNDSDDEAVSLKDAKAAWAISDSITATFGRFKEPILHSGIHSSSRRLMVERTYNGGDFDDRNAGIMLNGGFGDLQWWAAYQEGEDGAGAMNNTQNTIRVVYNVMGSAFGKYQGAYGYEGSNLSIGLASVNDDNSRLEAMAMEVGYVNSGWSLYADMVDEDGGGSPTSFTVSRMMGSEYEIAVRMEDEDDLDDTSNMIAGINWYQGGDGHNLKWQLNFTNTDSDANDGSRVDFGLVWSF